MQNQIARLGHLHAQVAQGLACRPMRHLALRVETRGVAGTGKAVCGLFHGTAEVRAGQAEGGESAFGVEQNRWRVGEKRARAEGELLGGTQVEFSLRRGVGFIVEEAEQAAEGERAAQPEKSSAGEF